MTLHPLAVAGLGFGAGEHITVLANVPPQVLSRRAVASSDGSFLVDFAEVEGTPSGLRVRARGSEGNAAIYAPRRERTN